MDASIVPAAVAAGQRVAARHRLPVDDVVILQSSNRLTIHLRHVTCWRLVLALAVAWRFEPGDVLPNAAARASEWVRQLRNELG